MSLIDISGAKRERPRQVMSILERDRTRAPVQLRCLDRAATQGQTMRGAFGADKAEHATDQTREEMANYAWHDTLQLPSVSGRFGLCRFAVDFGPDLRRILQSIRISHSMPQLGGARETGIRD